MRACLAGLMALSLASPGLAAGAAPAATPSPPPGACGVNDYGEHRLCLGARDRHIRQKMRLTFSAAFGRYVRVIDLVERDDGAASIRLKTVTRDGELAEWRSRRLDADDMARLEAVGEASGVWALPEQSWNGGGIFLHCEELAMERVTGAGYRSSQVNISCVQPEKLMPFVDLVVALARLKPWPGGQMY
jgi:hypothetical protein